MPARKGFHMTMRIVATLHYSSVEPFVETIELLGESIEIRHYSCDRELSRMAERIRELDGLVSAIALEGVAQTLSLGGERVQHAEAGRLSNENVNSPVVDGNGVRAAMERWATRLAAENQPGIFSRKRVLMVPGLNHIGLSEALGNYADQVRFADPSIYFALPAAPMVGWSQTLDVAGGFTLSQLRDFPFARLFPTAGEPQVPRAERPFQWADVLAGDMGAIRRYAPSDLKRKTIVTESLTKADLMDLQARGAHAVVTTMPALNGELATLDAATFEACLIALLPNKGLALNENTYLNLMADLKWQPGIRYLQPESADIRRFAFVIHPLSVDFIHSYRPFRWTKYFPDRLVERVASYIPPVYLSRITGIQSPTTGQKVEGFLIALGGTPRQLMRRDPSFVYHRLVQASRMAERLGARIMGLGAFTSVVGDAGITVAQRADIAITSGNSLTVAATLEAAKQAVVKMGNSLEQSQESNVMIIGATGSIGSVCSRLLAQAGPAVTLVAPRPEKLIALKRTIEEETPGARVTISTSADEHVAKADLIVATTTALNTRIVDIRQCKPGAVICDIARPPDISEEESALRPDVLVIESGEILLPGDPDYGYDIGLPRGVAYACLAETALLALEGRYEDYTLGRNIDIERVKEMYRLFKKHQLKLSGLRSHGHFLKDEDIVRKRELAEELRKHPERVQEVVARNMATMTSKQVEIYQPKQRQAWLGVGIFAAMLAVAGYMIFGRRVA